VPAIVSRAMRMDQVWVAGVYALTSECTAA
jgi:hypothetical protein